MAQSKSEEGLLKGVLSQLQLGGLSLTPQLTERDIVIELNADQLKVMLLEKADARARNSVFVELHENKLVLRIRLW